MKCDPSLSQRNSLIKGVRGDWPRFPQPTSPDSVVYLEHYQPLPPLHPSALPEEQERHRNQEALRQCVFQLQWTHQQLSQYIVDQFEGQQFYQLTPEEVIMLIYCLRTLLMSSACQEELLDPDPIGACL